MFPTLARHLVCLKVYSSIYCVLQVALGHLSLYRFPMEKKRLHHQKQYQKISKCKQIYTNIRLQLNLELFWYRNYQKMHEMVKYRSSRALVWTNRSGISRRVFFNSKKCWKMITWCKKTQKCCFSWKNLWEAICLKPKLEKTNVPT